MDSDRRWLLDFGVALIPAALAWKIPGGRLAEDVEVDLIPIVLATAPWTFSVALCAWLWIAGADYQPLTVGGVVVILGLGALIAPALQSEFVGAAVRAGQVPHGLLGEHKEAIEQVVADHARRDPRIGAIVGIGAVAFRREPRGALRSCVLARRPPVRHLCRLPAQRALRRARVGLAAQHAGRRQRPRPRLHALTAEQRFPARFAVDGEPMKTTLKPDEASHTSLLSLARDDSWL